MHDTISFTDGKKSYFQNKPFNFKRTTIIGAIYQADISIFI